MLLVRQFLGLSAWIRILIVFVLIWAFSMYVFATKLNPPSMSEQEMKILRRLNDAIQVLEQTKVKNTELQSLIDEFVNDRPNLPAAQKFIKSLETRLQHDQSQKQSVMHVLPLALGEPKLQYEQLRRRVRGNTQEFWNFFSAELQNILKKLSSNIPDIDKQINGILKLGAEHKRSLINDIDQMRTMDGYEQWREKESNELSDLVQRRLHYLQNPSDCKTARKLLCKLNKGCGYGCQLHHVVYCFIVAYATERTLILKSKGWRYHKAGWEEVFKPLSETCQDIGSSSNPVNWPGSHDTQIVILPIIDSLVPRPPYLPLAIPADLAPRLMRLHGDPIVWWVGQFLKYLLRPQHATEQMLNIGMERLGFKKPIVGVHVRRTDKVGTEAAFHNIDEYMTYVEDYFLQLEMNGTEVKRRVFIASDDARVLDEARKKYTNYEIVGDPEVAKMAAVSTRYTDSSLNGIVLDIHILSLCDYLVCTFSSQVCRVAYEIMQNLHPDAADHFKSLDDIYYYGGQRAHNREVIIGHKPRNHDEIHMRPDDLVGVAGNHWNGFSKGKNVRTNQIGLFPSFKVNDKVETVSMPTYPNLK